MLTLDLDKAYISLNREELRTQPRIPAYLLAFIRSRLAPPSDEELAPVWDISAGGIGLLYRRRLRRGETLNVRFRQAMVAERTATVVHTSAKAESWLIGCTLDPPLSASELQALSD